MFSDIYPSAYNAILIAKLLYILVLSNLIEIPLIIKRRIYLGIIHECAMDKAFFITKKANAFKALMMGAAIEAGHMPNAASDNTRSLNINITSI